MSAPLAGYVAVVGPSEADAATLADAVRVAESLARRHVVVLTGGGGGVMGAAAEGAVRGGGSAVGLLPGLERAEGSAAHGVLLPTGLGELRNGLLVRSADVVVSIGCSWGTLSEMALAVKTGVPLVALRPWPLPDDAHLHVVDDADAAVVRVLELLPVGR